MKRQRSTKQRKLVYDTVQVLRNHPTADEIYLHLRTVEPKISRGTVYRNLNLLTENGEVRHVTMPDADRFDWRMERHSHLRCTECGAMIDAPIAYRAELDAQLSKDTGFQVQRHMTVFEGLCPQCASAQQTSRDDAHPPEQD